MLFTLSHAFDNLVAGAAVDIAIARYDRSLSFPTSKPGERVHGGENANTVHRTAVRASSRATSPSLFPSLISPIFPISSLFPCLVSLAPIHATPVTVFLRVDGHFIIVNVTIVIVVFVFVVASPLHPSPNHRNRQHCPYFPVRLPYRFCRRRRCRCGCLCCHRGRHRRHCSCVGGCACERR